MTVGGKIEKKCVFYAVNNFFAKRGAAAQSVKISSHSCAKISYWLFIRRKKMVRPAGSVPQRPVDMHGESFATKSASESAARRRSAATTHEEQQGGGQHLLYIPPANHILAEPNSKGSEPSKVPTVVVQAAETNKAASSLQASGDYD